MRKFLSIMLALVMVFSMSTFAMASTFEDVADTHEHYTAIEALHALDLVQGYDKYTFGPDDSLTRAQAATMVVRALCEKRDIFYSNKDNFTDVDVNHWARIYIDTAVREDLMVGMGNKIFAPEEKLTYTQAARIVLNILDYGHLSWPNGVIAEAYDLDLFDNINTKNANAYITRGEMAQMIYNAFDCKLDDSRDYFLEDVLGYEAVEYLCDEGDNAGHILLGFVDEDDDLIETDIRLTYEKTIYSRDNGMEYSFSKKSGKTYEIEWYWLDKKFDVKLYMDGEEVTEDSEKYFDDYEFATGIFDEDDELISLYIKSDGVTAIPGDEVPRYIEKDKKYDEETSTVTYWNEDEYFISNDVKIIKIDSYKDLDTKDEDDHRHRIYATNGEKYYFDWTPGKNFQEGDWIILYFDYQGEIAGYDILNK